MTSRITINPAVMGGAPCIRDTRITVTAVNNLHDVVGIEDIVAEYPDLTARDVFAAMGWDDGDADGKCLESWPLATLLQVGTDEERAAVQHKAELYFGFPVDTDPDVAREADERAYVDAYNDAFGRAVAAELARRAEATR